VPRGFSYCGFVNCNDAPNRKPSMDTDGYYTEHALDVRNHAIGGAYVAKW
jgi:hypothetical protein